MKKVKAKIAPSLLSGDFAQLASECNKMLDYGTYIHSRLDRNE